MNAILNTLIDTLNNVNDKPLFCPAIYDLKAKLANCIPSGYGRNADEIYTALEQEIEILNLKIVTSAFDIYNIEAEAVGARVSRKGNYMPEIEIPLINSLDDVTRLKKIENTSGRMDVFINAAKAVMDKYGSGVYVRCGISGPFSMASKIYPGDRLLVDCILNSDQVTGLLRFCTETIKVYLNGIIRNNINVVVFDSFASPPLVSPEIYRDLIFPFHKELFDCMKDHNIRIRPLIIGGNSISLLEHMSDTGANSFLLDFNIEDDIREKILKDYENSAFRINIDPSIICNGNISSISDYMVYFLKRFGRYRHILIGTGILPFITPLENLKRVNQMINEYYD